MEVQEEVSIKLRYLEITADEFTTLIVSPNHEALKQQALDRMKIRCRKGESALDAWLRYLSEINRTDHTKPIHSHIADAICMNKAAVRFMWFLA